jgi:hypothetical protein
MGIQVGRAGMEAQGIGCAALLLLPSPVISVVMPCVILLAARLSKNNHGFSSFVIVIA